MMRARRLLVLAAAGLLLSGCATGAGSEGPSAPGADGVDAPVFA
jgi:outer membrane biogenesis lipoprotein LolB